MTEWKLSGPFVDGTRPAQYNPLTRAEKQGGCGRDRVQACLCRSLRKAEGLTLAVSLLQQLGPALHVGNAVNELFQALHGIDGLQRGLRLYNRHTKPPAAQ